MSFYYPALTAEQFFFAYPDDESMELFFNQTLGQELRGGAGMSSLGYGLFWRMTGISIEDLRDLKSKICVDGMPANVAAIACWLMMNEKFDFEVDLQAIAHPYPSRVYENRPLALALTNDLVVNSEGEIDGMMDVESMGLIDCARRTVNQIRLEGQIVEPVQSINDNFLELMRNLKMKLATPGEMI